MKPLITCDHVDFGYENIDAVIDVTLQINPGDYIGVVGVNGSGKSTLMKGILGLLKPTSGTLLMSEELRDWGIGYLPQQTAAQRDFPATVFEVVLSGCLSRRGNRPFYTREEKQLARANMEKLGLTELTVQCYRELSGGQQQRALIARALCATKNMLVLDEPITGLDPSAIQDFYSLIGRLNKEEQVAVLMVSHDIGNIVDKADKILHMDQKVLYWGDAKGYADSKAGKQFLGRGTI